MTTISIAAADEQCLNDALSLIAHHGDTSDWEALETLDVLGAITWDDNDNMWRIVDGVQLVVKVEHKIVNIEVENYPRSEYPRRVTYTCTCGKQGTVNDGRVAASYRSARAAHRRHVAAASKGGVK